MNSPETPPPVSSSPYPRIVYWKWTPEILEGRRYRRLLPKLARTAPFDTYYLSPVHSGREADDPVWIDAVADAVRVAHRNGLRIILDIDLRGIRRGFVRQHPGALLSVIHPVEIELDPAGRGRFESWESGTADHWGEYEVVGSGIERVYFFRKGRSNPVIAPSASVGIRRKGPGRIRGRVEGGPGTVRALVCVRYDFDYPDPFAPEAQEELDRLRELYREIPLDGVCFDEWGFPPAPGWRFAVAWRRPWYGRGLAAAYREATGCDWIDDTVLRTPGIGVDEAESIRAGLRTVGFVRRRFGSMEADLHRTTKEFWGGDAFVGVHPTWHAIDETRNSVEIWKNGFDWFEATRDVAQTDEWALPAIRAALAHRMGSAVFYNMMYPMLDWDIRAFVEETWNNVRIGGRTHYLGMPNGGRDPFERTGGAFAEIRRLEERVALLDHVQTAAVDCPILVLMGYNAAVHWRTNRVDADGVWDLDAGPFVESFDLARALWNRGFRCDLVPTTEIENGALTADPDGAPRLGTQRYRAVIVVRPEFGDASLLDFLGRVSVPRRLYGSWERKADGRPLSRKERDRLARIGGDPYLPLPIIVMKWLNRQGIRENAVPCGSILQDGMHVVASAGDRARGWPVMLDAEIRERRVEMEAEDILAIRLDGRGRIDALAAGSLRRLRIDGRTPGLPPAARPGRGRDVVLVRRGGRLVDPRG